MMRAPVPRHGQQPEEQAELAGFQRGGHHRDPLVDQRGERGRGRGGEDAVGRAGRAGELVRLEQLRDDPPEHGQGDEPAPVGPQRARRVQPRRARLDREDQRRGEQAIIDQAQHQPALGRAQPQRGQADARQPTAPGNRLRARVWGGWRYAVSDHDGTWEG